MFWLQHHTPIGVTPKLSTFCTACTGVFDGHGFNGRSAATYARKNIIKWLSVDSNATSKDPKKRSRALESVCSQIYRGLARSELCGFDASSSGLAACFGIVQGNKLCLAAMGMHQKSVLHAPSQCDDASRVNAKPSAPASSLCTAATKCALWQGSIDCAGI